MKETIQFQNTGTYCLYYCI